jgi:hypothetical protein
MILNRSSVRVEYTLATTTKTVAALGYPIHHHRWVRRRTVSGITRSQGRWAVVRMRSKANVLPGFQFIYQDARVPRTRSRRRALLRHTICDGWLRLRLLLTRASRGPEFLVSCRYNLAVVKHSAPVPGNSLPGPNCVVGEDITTCARIDCIRRSDRQSDKATVNRFVGEELS